MNATRFDFGYPWSPPLDATSPDGDVLVHAGDFMNAGYDPHEIISFNKWLGEGTSPGTLAAHGVVPDFLGFPTADWQSREGSRR